MTIPEMMAALHVSLLAAGLPHAFGGALALAWCTRQARGTIDIDLNVFIAPSEVSSLVEALPAGPVMLAADRAALESDGQVRIRWDGTPLDLFLSTTEFHHRAERRVRWEEFGGQQLPFLDCGDLAVFKAFFNRTRDWADLEEMAVAGTLDIDATVGTLTRYLGSDDERIARIRSLDRISPED